LGKDVFSDVFLLVLANLKKNLRHIWAPEKSIRMVHGYKRVARVGCGAKAPELSRARLELVP